MRLEKFAASGLIVAEATSEDASGLGISDPFVHTFGIGEGGEPFEQSDEPFSLTPVALAKSIAQVLAAGLGAVVCGDRFADGEQKVAKR